MKLKELGFSLFALALFASPIMPAQAQPTAEVIHFWTSGGESKAIRVIVEAFEKRGGKWIDTAVAGGDAARSMTLSRIQGGTPPTAMMWNIGTAITELASQGLLNDVDAVAEAGGWKKALPPLIWERATFDGHVIAVPVNIHGENWLYSNRAILTELGAEVPKTWDEFFTVADKAKAAGYIPLALGGEPWQEVLLFRAIVAAQEGAEFYRKVFVERDPAAAGSDKMKSALKTLARLKGYVDPGSPGRNWNDATNLVLTKKALFQVMGDWAKGEIVNAGLAPGADIACSMPPGGGSGFIVAVDTFAFPKTDKAEQVEAQKLLAEVLMDPEVQVTFNLAKGSVPIRQDVGNDRFDECGKLALKILSNVDNQLPNAALAMTDDMEGAIEDMITQFWNSNAPDVDAAATALADIIKRK